MLLLNFSHPLTADHLAQVEALTGQILTRVIDLSVQIDQGQPLAGQIVQIADDIGLTAQDWQMLSFVVNLPGYAPAAAVLLAELHGRMGHFATVLRMGPMADSKPTRYEVKEVVELQSVRDTARGRRSDQGSSGPDPQL